MDKSIGKEFAEIRDRESFLKDNCDAVEEKGYMKPFTKEQLQGHKEKLANLSIEIEQVETEKKEAAKHYKERLDPLISSRKVMVSNIRQKSEYKHEICYKFVDQAAKETGYYNNEGDLVEIRPATADELQPTIFSINRKTGTDDI